MVNESVSALIHEEVHIIQQYGGRHGKKPLPGWLTEGIADYIRWWKFEPASVRMKVSARRNGKAASYTDSYRTTAAFLEFTAANYDHEIVLQLNEAGRDANYDPALWKTYTGFTVDELWTKFVSTLGK